MDRGGLPEAEDGQRVVFGVDVAKADFYGVLMVGDAEVLATLTWQHPSEMRTLGAWLRALPAAGNASKLGASTFS